MKIVVIEDGNIFALALQMVLEKAGHEVRICTMGKFSMPGMEDVVAVIQWSEMVLLDWDLKADYDGERLLAFCGGKKIIGISSTGQFGPTVNFPFKEALANLVRRTLGVRDEWIQEKIEKLVELVNSEIPNWR